MLRGQGILITRPASQAGSLAAGIESAGGVPRVFPLLRIAPIADESALAAAVADLPDSDFAAFVSPNAVAASLPAIRAAGAWPSRLSAVAVGAGTARALREFGVPRIIVPGGRFDSEALLELPELAADRVGGKKAVIFRGDGGRELLADSLRERGAVVNCVSCYRRLPPADFAPLRQWIDGGAIDAVSVTSSESLRHLVAGLDSARIARLRQLPFFTSHPRIADNAAAAGFTRVVLTAAGDDGLIEALCAYNWPDPRVP